MAITINADNGIVSGTSGLKYLPDNSGVIQFQTSGVSTMTIDTSRNVVMANSANVTGVLNTANVNTTGALFVNGAVTFANSTSNTVYVTANGNIGINTIPSNWANSVSGTIENLSGGLYPYHPPGGGAYDVGIFVNAFYDGNWKYKNSGSSSGAYFIATSNTGTYHTWRVSNTGNASNTITYSDVMVITPSGSVGINNTTPTDRLTVLGRVTIQQDNVSNSRLVFRAVPGQPYRWSIDNDSSNYLRIFRENDSDATSGIVLASFLPGGEFITPHRTAFRVERSGQQTFSAGNTIVFNNEIFDVGGNFNSSTGVFTAPVTGKYLFTCQVLVQGASTGNEFEIQLVTSNRSMYGGNPGRIEYQSGTSWGDGYISLGFAHITDMDASDTAYVTMPTFGGGSIYGGAGWTTFCGYLLG